MQEVWGLLQKKSTDAGPVLLPFIGGKPIYPFLGCSLRGRLRGPGRAAITRNGPSTGIAKATVPHKI